MLRMRPLGLSMLLAVTLLSTADGAAAPQRLRRLGAQSMQGKNDIIYATNPGKAGKHVPKASAPKAASHQHHHHHVNHFAVSAKTYSLVPTAACPGKVKLCYEGDESLLTTIQKKDTFNPCHGDGSNIREGPCAISGYTDFVSSDPMYKKAKLFKVPKSTAAAASVAALGGGYSDSEDQTTPAPYAAPALPTPYGTVAAYPTPPPEYPTPYATSEPSYPTPYATPEPTEPAYPTPYANPMEAVIYDSSTPDKSTPAPYPTPYMTEYVPTTDYKNPEPADELYDIQAAQADPESKEVDHHWWVLPSILGSIVLVCCCAALTISCCRHMTEPLPYRKFEHYPKSSHASHNPSHHPSHPSIRPIPPMNKPGHAYDKDAGTAATAARAGEKVDLLLRRVPGEVRRNIAKELQIPKHPNPKRGASDPYVIEYSDLLEWHLIQSMKHTPSHIVKLRKFWKQRLQALEEGAEQAAQDPEHLVDGYLTHGTTPAPDSPGGYGSGGGGARDRQRDQSGYTAEHPHAQVRMKLQGDLKKLKDQAKFIKTFETELANHLQVDSDRVQVDKLSAGSIVVDFKLHMNKMLPDGTAELKETLKKVEQTEKMSLSHFFRTYAPDPYFAVEHTIKSFKSSVKSEVKSMTTKATAIETKIDNDADKKFHKVEELVQWNKKGTDGASAGVTDAVHTVTATAVNKEVAKAPAVGKKATKSKIAGEVCAPPDTMYAYKAPAFPSYKDPAFPPSLASIGDNSKWSDDQHRCVWKRCGDIGLTQLWEKDPISGHCIDPSDINQGQLGDCWLLSSLSCLAEFESAVEDLFVTKEYNPEGVYTVLLYDTGVFNADGTRGSWVHVTVDDHLPCLEASGSKSPAFAHPKNSNELWVAILEKAFAKAFGSYQNISGGYNWFAFQMLTGCDTVYFSYSQQHDLWQEDFTQYPNEEYSCAAGNTKVSKAVYVNKDADGSKDDEELWSYLKEADAQNWLIAASTKGVDHLTEGGGPQANKGMVDGHAYSVIVVQEVDEHRLLCIRNPWGTFEWPGDWSDGSEMWNTYPHVRSRLIELNAKNEEYLQFNDKDGLFWMDFKDFTDLFAGIVFCRRTEPIHFNKREEHAQKCTHCSGPLFEIPGKFSGQYMAKKNGVKVHTECWDEYLKSTKPKCMQCGEPIMKIEGKFGGKFFRIPKTKDHPNGKVHTECWDGKGTWYKK